MSLPLKGKAALVTGASRGSGSPSTGSAIIDYFVDCHFIYRIEKGGREAEEGQVLRGVKLKNHRKAGYVT
ncbi:hypothetical protein [Desmospora profundinema]|uniref:NADPH-dependent FMN reductase-like domain-containing protein n=1 Tax=Desmospora profundinema TaxID=1571184 RepID=A0ABU1IRI2_9BACL|nr:hypothetical protein [Desmospora profundinema]MDR6226544.1 hypothetical protein [Desmospora profundinema]